MNKGYILLARSLLDSAVFASKKLLKIWVWCLLKANHRNRVVTHFRGEREQIIRVNRGQFIFGRHKAEEELMIDGSTIYKCMKKIESLGMIKIDSSNRYSVITINKYNDFQEPDNYKVTAEEQQSNSRVTAEEQQSNTNNTLNKLNTFNNKSHTKRIYFDVPAEKIIGITEKDLDNWGKAYPEVKINQEILRAELWLIANPKRRKKNIYQFLTNWFNNSTKNNSQPNHKNEKYKTRNRKSRQPASDFSGDISFEN